MENIDRNRTANLKILSEKEMKMGGKKPVKTEIKWREKIFLEKLV